MPSSPTALESLIHEHRALLSHYGRTQLRCSELLRTQARQIEQLQAQLSASRARALVQTTALAWAQQDHASFSAATPGLPRRIELARRMQGLLQRVQQLMREKQKWRWSKAVQTSQASQPMQTAQAEQPAQTTPASSRPRTRMTVVTRPVLWIVQNQTAAPLPGDSLQPLTARRASGDVAARHVLVPGLTDLAGLDGVTVLHGFNGLGRATSEGSFAHDIEADQAALESSLAAADMVICQTGCLSHNDYWRVQDHCKRTGKTCVLTDDARMVDINMRLPIETGG